MRPLPGDDTGRPRSTSFDSGPTPLATRTQPPQMSYFLADEKTMEAGLSHPPTSLPKPRDVAKHSNYGVESLETTISSLAQDSDDSEELVRKARRNWKGNIGQQTSKKSDEDLANATSPVLDYSFDNSRNSSPSHQRRTSQASISRPYTPLSFAPSIMGSPSSRRSSDAGSYMDDVASQAIVSSGEEDRDVCPNTMVDSGSTPQLVMPSIKMPSRRPFTERGKNIGRLKMMIAGDSGVGKTSLIKAIVQTCEDIVHVDPISPIPASVPETRRKSPKGKRNASVDTQATANITEVYASTRAYPAWWSDLEESRILRRRKSMGDSVLERNLCFVDTPGYSNQTSLMECISPIIEYVESQFKKTSAFENLSESETINMLSGNGGSQVDVVLYVILDRVKPVDIEYLRRLSELTNVIPLIARAESYSPEKLSSLKEHILSELEAANIRPFLFGLIPEAARQSSQPSVPYAISTMASKDNENMDASLLMSPDYVQPLIKSELHHLVSRIFDQDAISWLRYSAAKKFLLWRNSNTPLSKPRCLYQPLELPSMPSSQVLTAPVGATTSYALARITDHTQREERMAQVRLASWAADLQRSLQNERARFESLARSERAVWLTERLGECVHDGTIVPISQVRKDGPQYDTESGALVKKGTYYRRRDMDTRGGIDRHDPLGLLVLNREIKRKGWVVLKVLSSFGLMGGLAFWVTRTWQQTEMTAWVRDWMELGAIDWR